MVSPVGYMGIQNTWTFLKNKIKKVELDHIPLEKDVRISNDSGDKAEILNSFLSSVIVRENIDTTPSFERKILNISCLTSEKAVLDSLANLNITKSVGPDD